MIKIIDLNKENVDIDALISPSQFDMEEVNDSVKDIVNDVKTKGDDALSLYTEKFDKASLDTFLVTNEAINQAYESASNDLINALKEAKENIEAYHKNQGFKPFEMQKDDGIILGQKVTPIEKVGLYIPGGSAAYPSTVLMNAIPAKIAGVKKTIMITPPDEFGNVNPTLLVAAKITGVDAVYKIGGAQGIAALAYGTDQIPKVDKIVGPGNIYVSMAKKLVSGHVGIDMIAGPSEILIIGDESSDPDYIAADLMSQAEHDVLASAILLTPSLKLANDVKEALSRRVKEEKRRAIIERSINDLGKIIVTDSLNTCIEISNRMAPEHLEIITVDPFDILKSIQNAGSIFLGAYAPEPLGDYYAGPNHTLPTSGTARFSSPLSTSDFQKKSSYMYYSKKAFQKASQPVRNLANAEGLYAHANSINVRLKGEK